MLKDGCWRTSEEGASLLGGCIRLELGKGQDLNLLGRPWPARGGGCCCGQDVSNVTDRGQYNVQSGQGK